MAAISSHSARTGLLSPAGLRNSMCHYMSGSEPGREGRARIMKRHQAIEARLGSLVELERSAKALGSCDALNPFSYLPNNIGVRPVLWPLCPEIFKKRTQAGISKTEKELGLKLARFRPEFFDVNFAQKDANPVHP